MFDGDNDYMVLNQSSAFNGSSNEFSVELWFKLYNGSETNPVLFSVDYDLLGKDLISFSIPNDNSINFTSYHDGVEEDLVGYNFSYDTNYYVVLEYNGTDKKIYVNSLLVYNRSVGADLNVSSHDIIIGANRDVGGVYDNYFSGLVDEVKISDRALTINDIRSYYLNYDSLAKGCCNYMIPVNANKFGFNNTVHEKNVSYSDKLFFDYFYRGVVDRNVTLYNISDFTSNNVADEYHNFRLDICAARAYDIHGFQSENNTNITVSVPVFGGDNGDCSELVKQGIY